MFNKLEIIKEKEDLNISGTFNTPILINDFPGSLTNWSWAKSQGYCTGSGTSGAPYIIQDHIFNTSSVISSCLTIMNSRKPFIVRDCFFIGVPAWAGVYLYNVTNGLITKNSNKVNTGALVYIENSSYNVISYNNASYNAQFGIYLWGGIGDIRNNIISNNLVVANIERGIFLQEHCYFNEISENTVLNNTIGIVIDEWVSNNTITENLIKFNDAGLIIAALCNGNMVYLNCFENKFLHALDLGAFNQWDNGVKGNYWDNYTGMDADGNGIGDIPYNITGSAGTKDNFPLMTCPFPTSDGGGIPGYNFLMILSIVGLITIIGIYITLKKKELEVRQ